MKGIYVVTAVLAAAALLAGCAAGATAGSTGGESSSPATAGPTAAPAAGTCHVRQGPLPDPACTPGAVNADVTQSNLSSTICRSGWTKTVRPPTSYTSPLKRQLMASYGESGSTSSYELDHLISLELGGSPTAITNLWPEPGASPNAKDKVENALHAAVCSGKTNLAAAQHAIATNWTTAETTLGL